MKRHHSTLLRCKFPVRIWIDRLSLHRIKVKYMRFSFSKWEFNSPWSGLGNHLNKMLGESYRRVTTSCSKDTTWKIKDNTAIISIISSPFTSISMWKAQIATCGNCPILAAVPSFCLVPYIYLLDKYSTSQIVIPEYSQNVKMWYSQNTLRRIV